MGFDKYNLYAIYNNLFLISVHCHTAILHQLVPLAKSKPYKLQGMNLAKFGSLTFSFLATKKFSASPRGELFRV
jgi:hypothetical protein